MNFALTSRFDDGAWGKLPALRPGPGSAMREDQILSACQEGGTAVRQIRDIEATGGRGRTPIAILSANALPEHIAVAPAAGADRHVAKPVRPDVLIDLVHELVFEGAPT